MVDYKTYDVGDLSLTGGGVLRDAQLAYQTYGTLSPNGDNVVVMPTFYTGSHERNEGYFGADRALDPARHFIVSINLFGGGKSSSPSNSLHQRGASFPAISFQDNIHAQHLLLTKGLGVQETALVLGWSMAGCQAYHWAVQYPDFVKSILPFCASARTSPHNFVFLEGVKAALCADPVWNKGAYANQPIEGLKAFGRVYAGWAFSQAFYRNGLYRDIGYDSIDALLGDWADDHAMNWDANDLLCKLATWQGGDVSAGAKFGGDFSAALGSIKARTILMPCRQDLYFSPEDNEAEAKLIPNADIRQINSDFGHCVANPGNDLNFQKNLDANIAELLRR